MPETTTAIEGQLNPAECTFLTKSILGAPARLEIVPEAGTWLGGGRTLHSLRALQANGPGIYGAY